MSEEFREIRMELTSQHDTDIVGKLDHARAATTDRLWRAFRDIGWDRGRYHSNADSTEESAKI